MLRWIVDILGGFHSLPMTGPCILRTFFVCLFKTLNYNSWMCFLWINANLAHIHVFNVDHLLWWANEMTLGYSEIPKNQICSVIHKIFHKRESQYGRPIACLNQKWELLKKQRFNTLRLGLRWWNTSSAIKMTVGTIYTMLCPWVLQNSWRL